MVRMSTHDSNRSSSTIQRMWHTRPPRITKADGGKAVIGGVCEGISARYNLDPVLVRVTFVLFALFFGGGLFMYLLCWFVMPRYGLAASPARAIATPKEQLPPAERGERSTGWWLLVGLIITVPSASTVGDSRGFLASILLFLLAWFLAYRRSPEPPAGLITPPETAL